MSLLDGRAVGRIHSVFETAMNIQIENELLTVLAAERNLYPRSILLAESVSFTDMGFAIDSAVNIEARKIRVGEWAVIDVRDAEFVSLLVRSCASVMDSHVYRTRLHVLADAIAQTADFTEGLAPVLCDLFYDIPFRAAHNVWSKFLMERICRLYDALCRGDIGVCLEIGNSIAGCGPGLTPSSDDFLVGVFAALYGAAEAGMLDKKIVADMCKNLSEGACSRTNIISMSFLKSGAQGHFGGDILDLISAFFTPNSRDTDLMTLARRVCASGATSGADTLVGIWFGLAACARIQTR